MYEWNIQISSFEISRYFVKRVFLTRGSSDGEGLSQLYLELADAYKKRFMPQKWSNRRIKKLSNMRKNESVKTSGVKAQVHYRKDACKRETMAVSAGKETYFPYGKRAEIRNVAKCFWFLL